MLKAGTLCRSNFKSTRTSKHPGTPLIPGIVKPLCKESLFRTSPPYIHLEFSFAAKMKWKWSSECSLAFSEAKQAISSATTILADYDASLSLTLDRRAKRVLTGCYGWKSLHCRVWHMCCMCICMYSMYVYP